MNDEKITVLHYISYIFLLLPTISVLFGMYFLKNAFLTIIIYHTGMVLILILTKNYKNFLLLFKGWKTIIGLPMILAGSSAGIFSFILWPLIFKKNLNLNEVLLKFGLNDSNWIIFILYFSLINPVFEEAFWRAYFTKMKIRFFLQDIFFAFYHLLVLNFFVKTYWLPAIFCFLFGASIIWRYIYKKNNGLLIPFLSHVLADISIAVIATIMRGR